MSETAATVRPPGELPFVSLHVPAHNEPPDMVIATLRALTRLDYPRFEIILIDDNTDDERLWRPVQEWCARHQVKFAHLEDWPGYKSEALNYALRKLTDERAEIVGVVDSDYLIEPDFLRHAAPLFDDPWVGFIQAPQDYRGWGHARYYRRLYAAVAERAQRSDLRRHAGRPSPDGGPGTKVTSARQVGLPRAPRPGFQCAGGDLVRSGEHG